MTNDQSTNNNQDFMTVAFLLSIKRYSFAGLAVAIALVIMLMLDPWVNMSKTPFLLFFSAVMASAWYGGLKPGLLATCLSIVFSNYFFLEPIYTLNFDLPNSVRSSLFFLDGLIISGLCNLLKNARRRSEINLHKLQSSQQRFKLALKSTDILIFHQDIELRYQWIYNHHNPERAEAILGKSEYDLFPTLEAEQLTKIKRKVIETGISAHEEVCLTVDGKSSYYDLMIEPLKINGEAIEGISCTAVNIGQRKQTEEALRYSEERYRSLVESLPQLVCISPELGLLDYCNQSWINYTGLTLEQAHNSGWQQIIHPDDLPVFISKWTKANLTGKAVSLEFRLRRVDGIYRWYLGRGVPIRNQDGNILSWLASGTDIDDQKRKEQIQRFLAESSRAFAEASLSMQAVMDSITRRVAELFADVCMLSLLSDDQLRLNLLSVHHVKPDAKELIAQLLANEDDATQSLRGRVIQTGKPILIPVVPEEQLYTAVKQEYWKYIDRFGVSSMLIVPLQVHGKIIGTLGVSRDRTGQPYNQHDQELLQDLADRAALAIENARLYREAQQARQKAEEAASRTARLQAVTAALSEALTPQQVADVVVNQGIAALGATSGSVTLLSDNDTNLKVVSAIGYPQSVRDAWATFPITLQAPLAETVRTGDPIFLKNLAELLARYPHLADTQAQTGNQAFAYIPLIVEGRKLGQFGISFAQEQAFGEEDKAFMLTLAQQCAQAIARAQLYEAEQNARDEAEVANRVKDEFLAVLSHELRTPLNPILGWSKLLRSRNLDEKTTIRALETIERNAQLQSQLIEDLLDISRIIRGNLNLNFSPVNLASTIQAAIETVALSAQARSVEIKAVIQPNIGQILGNSERLQQVIWNLLSNAIKFTPLGGQVEIVLETVDSLLPINDGNPQLAINQEQSTINNYAQIKVTDTGRGISPDFLPYVFDYFRQADATTTRTFGGLGLGLAIVRHLVELHGGSVQAESKGEGQGATFIVKLPLMPVQPAINEKIELPSDSPNLSEVKILVVDDEADSLDFCAFVLEQQGAIVTKVASATAALKALAESQPDVLVSDIGMPEMDGYMLMRQIRALPLEQGGRLRAIALTAYASEADQEQALAAGFHNHLSKPVEPSELAKSIANLIASN